MKRTDSYFYSIAYLFFVLALFAGTGLFAPMVHIACSHKAHGLEHSAACKCIKDGKLFRDKTAGPHAPATLPCPCMTAVIPGSRSIILIATASRIHKNTRYTGLFARAPPKNIFPIV